MRQIDRRRFVREFGAAAAVAAGALSGRPAQAASRPAAAKPALSQQPNRWKMKLSTSSIHFKRLMIEQACARIAKLGFEAIDIWSAYQGCPHLDDVQRRLGADGLRQLLERTGLKLFSFSVYRGGYPKYARVLGEAGGGVAVRGSTRPCPPDELVKRMKQFLERLKPEIELAEKYDSYLAIENHGHALLDSLDSFQAFVDLNRSQRLGIALAPFHLQARGEPVVEAVKIAGEQLFFFYAWQRSPGLGQLPGHGPADFTTWLAALAEVNYRYYVNPFMHHEPEPDTMAQALAKAKRYLIACYQRIGKPG